MTKNKSCPFCGSQHLSIELIVPAWGSSEKEAHIVCDECAGSAPCYIWNARKEQSRVTEDSMVNKINLRVVAQ